MSLFASDDGAPSWCPEGWSYLAHTGKCYKFFGSLKMGMEDARKFCKQFGPEVSRNFMYINVDSQGRKL